MASKRVWTISNLTRTESKCPRHSYQHGEKSGGKKMKKMKLEARAEGAESGPE